MNIRDYWQQGSDAYREVKQEQALEQLAAECDELVARFEKVRAVKCNCELLDAHQCYADQHETTEGDDSKFCRCRCHRIAEREHLVD